MALSERDRNKLIDLINTRFADIGTNADTCSPFTSDNKGTEAWELFIAGHLSTLASGRLKEARRRAVRSGIIFDPDKHPKTPEDSGTIYKSDHITVTLLVKQGSKAVDVDELCSYLVKKGVDTALLSDAYEHASKTRRPAHEFRATVITTED